MIKEGGSRTDGFKRQFDEELARLGNKTLFVAKDAAATFLKYEGYPSRSFHFIRHRLRGFTDSELRQILVRARAVQFTGDASEERWGLWNRNSHLVKSNRPPARAELTPSYQGGTESQ